MTIAVTIAKDQQAEGRKIPGMPDPAFDLRDAARCYALMEELTTKRNKKISGLWEIELNPPIAIILPARVDSYDDTRMAIRLEACQARGTKGEKTVTPFLQASRGEMARMKKNGAQSVLAGMFRVAREGASFHLTIIDPLRCQSLKPARVLGR